LPWALAALLKRKRRAAGRDPVNAKRVYRLTKKHGLLLARHTGRRVLRAHDGIITSRSNGPWCSDVLESTCWNGDVVRVAFVLDSHDREVISWVATTAGMLESRGEMIRDMMVQCVEHRFGDLRAPRRVQWLTDNGSIFAANRTLEIAAALNTPVESPGSNGMAEAFVKTFKRDYVRINPIPDAPTTLSRIDPWLEDYKLRTPAFPAGLPAHRGSTLHHFNKPRVRFKGETPLVARQIAKLLLFNSTHR
jgi:transposase InsO family protein